MPALVNSSVGSLPGTSELDGTMLCPLRSKNLRSDREFQWFHKSNLEKAGLHKNSHSN